jgi:hypothetical protein
MTTIEQKIKPVMNINRYTIISMVLKTNEDRCSIKKTSPAHDFPSSSSNNCMPYGRYDKVILQKFNKGVGDK